MSELEWKQLMHGDFQAHVAEGEGFRLSVIGSGDMWHWIVRCEGSDTVEGKASNLAAAIAAAEAEAADSQQDA